MWEMRQDDFHVFLFRGAEGEMWSVVMAYVLIDLPSSASHRAFTAALVDILMPELTAAPSTPGLIGTISYSKEPLKSLGWGHQPA